MHKLSAQLKMKFQLEDCNSKHVSINKENTHVQVPQLATSELWAPDMKASPETEQRQNWDVSKTWTESMQTA